MADRDWADEKQAGHTMADRLEKAGLVYWRDVNHFHQAVDILTEFARQARAEGRREGVTKFTDCIQHGDEVHRAWLREACEQFLHDGTVPRPRALAQQDGQ